MRNGRRRTPRPWARELLGAAIVAAMVLAIFISYNAVHGLPLQSRYAIAVELPNAQELHLGDPVQIGGARVGLVAAITAEPGHPRPYARLELTIFGAHRIPRDSTVSVRALSILGAKALVIAPGESPQALSAQATLPLAQARPAVDLNDALSAFPAPTRHGLQGVITGLAAGVAGRGDDVNQLLATLPDVLGSLKPVSENLASPATNLPGLVDAVDALLQTLDPQSAALPSLLGHAATTFGAVLNAQPAFGETLAALPGAEATTTHALIETTPALQALRRIVDGLSPAGPQLRPAVSGLDSALVAAEPALHVAPSLASPLNGVATALNGSVPPSSAGLYESLEGLDQTVRSVQAITSVVGPAQEVCNVLGTTLRNGNAVIGEGDAQGAWFTFLPLITPFLTPTGSLSANTHVNDHPVEDSSGCAAGNVPFLPGPQTGNPAASVLTTAHDTTAPPSSATTRARAAGLLSPPAGARL